MDTLVVYALTGQSVEIAIETTTPTTPVKFLGSSGFKAVAGAKVGDSQAYLPLEFYLSKNKAITLSGAPSGFTIADLGSKRIIIVDKKTAGSLWAPRLADGTTGHNHYDLAADIPSVLVKGPYLVRSATAIGAVLALTGDVNSTTIIDVFAPIQFTGFTWNGAAVTTTRSDLGSLRGTVTFPAALNSAVVPVLSQLSWSCADSLPELASGFDDSKWVLANKTSTRRPQKPTAGKVRHSKYPFRYVLTCANFRTYCIPPSMCFKKYV